LPEVESLLITGEALNASIKTVEDAIVARDDNLVARLAKVQVEAGAKYTGCEC
jgi:hypothetical protein